MALTEQQVKDLYAAVLFREPNDHELNVGQSSSEEALTEQLIATSAVDVQPFIRLYQAAFNRIPDADGLDFWVNKYRDGNLNIWDYTAKIVDTPEFHATFDHIPVADGVNQIYQYALGRNAEASGLNFWVAQINSGAKTFTDVLFDISQSDEAKARSNAAVENLQSQVAAGDAEFDGQGSLNEWTPAPQPEPSVDYTLTINQDSVALKAGDTVSGVVAGNQFTDTYTAGDVITGVAGSDNAFTLSLSGTPTTNDVTVKNVDHVVINSNATAAAALTVSKWTGIEDVAINNVRANFTLNDIQEGSTWFNINDARTGNPTIKLDYDSNETTNVANIGVSEVKGTVKVTKDDVDNGVVETINLKINDVSGKESVLADLEGQGTKTLNITGGNAGRTFEITGALDSTLTKVDGSAALANLKLNVTEGTGPITVLTGTGDDVVNAGNRLRTGDVYDLGAGNDRLVADFTTANPSERAPTIDNVEVLDVAFNAAVRLSGTNIDHLPTIDLRASSSRANFNNFDGDLKTVNVLGKAAQGLEVDYDGKTSDTNLTVNFKADAGNAGNSTALKVINGRTVNANLLGGVTLSHGIQLDDNTSHVFTTDFTLTHKASGKAVVQGHEDSRVNKSAIVDGNTVERLTVVTEQDGHLSVGDGYVAGQIEAANLQDLKIETKAANSSIEIGAIGREGYFTYGGHSEFEGKAAVDLETVTITAANYSKIISWGIDADSTFAFGGGAASSTNIDITAGGNARIELNGSYGREFEVSDVSNIGLLTNSGTFYTGVGQRTVVNATISRDATGYNWLQTGSIGTLNITAAEGAHVQGNVTETATRSVTEQDQVWSRGQWQNEGSADKYTQSLYNFECLIGLDLEKQSNGHITVEGKGTVTGFWFEDEVAQIIDATGLTGKSGAHSITDAGFDAFFGKDVADALGLGARGYDFAVLTKANNLSDSGSETSPEYYNSLQHEGASVGYTFLGSAGADYVVGTDYADVLEGNNGNDFLIGNGGSDKLFGGEGDDILVGDALEGDSAYSSQIGSDTIVGGKGNDIIIGGAGRDFLWGDDQGEAGTGSDLFVYNFQAGSKDSGKGTHELGNDVIYDFNPAHDKIIVDVANPNPNGTSIAFFDGSDWTFDWGGFDTNPNVVVRRGTYSDDGTGTFNVYSAGNDYQVLFLTEGLNFGPFNLQGNGQDAYGAAAHEIALVGAALHSGSFDHTDIVFV